jgi:hypothetical protein
MIKPMCLTQILLRKIDIEKHVMEYNMGVY